MTNRHAVTHSVNFKNFHIIHSVITRYYWSPYSCSMQDWCILSLLSRQNMFLILQVQWVAERPAGHWLVLKLCDHSGQWMTFLVVTIMGRWRVQLYLASWAIEIGSLAVCPAVCESYLSSPSSLSQRVAILPYDTALKKEPITNKAVWRDGEWYHLRLCVVYFSSVVTTALSSTHCTCTLCWA